MPGPAPRRGRAGGPVHEACGRFRLGVEGKSVLTVLYALLYYVAAIIFVVGVAKRVWEYWKTPQPAVIPTTPAPVTRTGVVWRMFKEVAFFESLWKSNKWIWIFAQLFHASLWLIIIRHLRYFLQPVPELIALAQPFGKYAGLTFVLGALGLLARRMLVARVRYISAPSDYLMLLLFLGIGLSGLTMTFVAKPDIIGVKAFFLGLMTFNWQPLPSAPQLLVHLGLVALWMIIFPFSKLLHAPGVFFSPTRNAVDDPREHFYQSPVLPPLDQVTQEQ